LQLNELKNINLDVVAEYTPEQVDVQKVALKWEAESLTASGRIGLTTQARSDTRRNDECFDTPYPRGTR
jgi:hypothetical protein